MFFQFFSNISKSCTYVKCYFKQEFPFKYGNFLIDSVEDSKKYEKESFALGESSSNTKEARLLPLTNEFNEENLKKLKDTVSKKL